MLPVKGLSTRQQQPRSSVNCAGLEQLCSPSATRASPAPASGDRSRRADAHLHSPDVLSLGCPTPASPECPHHIADLSLSHTFG